MKTFNNYLEEVVNNTIYLVEKDSLNFYAFSNKETAQKFHDYLNLHNKTEGGEILTLQIDQISAHEVNNLFANIKS